jgi:hypothetical protein
MRVPAIFVPLYLASVQCRGQNAVKMSPQCLAESKKAPEAFVQINKIMNRATINDYTHDVNTAQNAIEVSLLIFAEQLRDPKVCLSGLLLLFACKDSHPSGENARKVLYGQLPMFRDDALIKQVKDLIKDVNVRTWYEQVILPQDQRYGAARGKNKI